MVAAANGHSLDVQLISSDDIPVMPFDKAKPEKGTVMADDGMLGTGR